MNALFNTILLFILAFILGYILFFVINTPHAPSSDYVKSQLYEIDGKKYKLTPEIVMCGL